MRSIWVLCRRVVSGKPVTRLLARLQAFTQPPKPSGLTPQVPAMINAEEIDPSDKDTWSRGPDLLWLHNTQDRQRKRLKAKWEKEFPGMGKTMPYIDLPEGRVHIARYFP